MQCKMSGKLPTEYNGLLRLLKEEQKHIQRLQEQVKKSKEEATTMRNQLTEKEKKAEIDQALVRNISSEMSSVKTNYSAMEMKMEQITRKWVQNTRLLNQYRYCMHACYFTITPSLYTLLIPSIPPRLVVV